MRDVMSPEMTPTPLDVRHIAAAGLTEPAGATWSNALIVGREVVLSGVTARGADGAPIGGQDAGAQTRAIFARMDALMKASGGGLENIFKLVIYVTDAAFKDDVNAARKACFKSLYPASTLIVVTGFAFPGLLVEVDAFAHLDANLHAAAARAATPGD